MLGDEKKEEKINNNSSNKEARKNDELRSPPNNEVANFLSIWFGGERLDKLIDYFVFQNGFDTLEYFARFCLVKNGMSKICNSQEECAIEIQLEKLGYGNEKMTSTNNNVSTTCAGPSSK